MFAAFFSVFAITVFWAIPWLPYGLTEADYDSKTMAMVILLLSASLTAFGAVFLRDRSKSMERSLTTWSSFRHGLDDQLQREYFYDRIVVECQRAKARAADFTVLALRVGPKLEEHDLVPKAIAALNSQIKESDCVAILAAHEVGVLVLDIGPAEARALAERLVAAVSAGSAADVKAGWAVYGRDGTEASDLVGHARRHLLEPGISYAPAAAA